MSLSTRSLNLHHRSSCNFIAESPVPRVRVTFNSDVFGSNTELGYEKSYRIKDEPADPNIIYEEPDDEASSSDKDVSDATLPARRTFSIVIFLASSVRRDKREMLSISQKQISPPMLPRSAYRGIERKDPGPEQVGLGYRAVSAVEGDTCHLIDK
uniref:Uncharacterized mitochondrial protein n=1 Tax=Solanum tuberosum TaxID=4113 RepID=M1BGV2_SOLTU